MDDELSANARQLIDFAMDADVPPPVVVEGSWGMVVSRLTLETAPEQSPAASPVQTQKARRWGAIFAVLAFAAVAASWLARPSDALDTPRATMATTPRAPTPVPTRAAATRPSPAIAPVASADGLLDDAEAILATDPARALATIDRHVELAPTIESDRRMALRIVVLCALGRNAEAKAQATAFLASARAPEWTERVRASCAG